MKSAVQNPFRQSGSYWSVVEALSRLGVGKLHPAAEVVKSYAKAQPPEQFRQFKAKKSRNDNGLDWQARVVQNCIVLCRADYGSPLREVGHEIRKQHDGERGYSFGLYSIKATGNARKAQDERKGNGKSKAKG